MCLVSWRPCILRPKCEEYRKQLDSIKKYCLGCLPFTESILGMWRYCLGSDDSVFFVVQGHLTMDTAKSWTHRNTIHDDSQFLSLHCSSIYSNWYYHIRITDLVLCGPVPLHLPICWVCKRSNISKLDWHLTWHVCHSYSPVIELLTIPMRHFLFHLMDCVLNLP